MKAATKANWKDPEFRAKQAAATKAASQSKLAWCPPELIEDYRLLARHLGADEARVAIELQMRRAQVIAICPTCEKRLDHPDCRACTLIGCPLVREAA